MPPRTASGRRRRWLLAAGVGCGVALAAYGARRAYLAGIAAGRASATPSPHPRRRKGEKAPSDDDDDDDDEEGDDDPSARPTPGPAHSTANGDVPPTPIGKKGALQQAAAAAAASTTPPCTPRGGPERASTPGEWRDRLTGRPRSNSAAAADDGASAVDLVATYDRIQREFTEANGAFDPAAVADAARWFHFEPPPGVGVWPVEYTKLGLPAGCTRLVVLMLEDAPAVAAAGAACAREVMRAMRGVGCFNVSRGAYHVTVFFLSLPTDPVEDPTAENGKKSRGGAVGFHPDHDAEEAAVHDALRGAVDVAPDGDASNRNGSRDNGVNGAGSKSHREDAVGEVTLEVDRVAMAKSGALLLLFRDPDGTLDRARRALRGAFPGAPSKQTAIAHCTLLRAFPRASGGDTPIGEDSSSSFGGALSGRALADVSASCARWTHRLAGARVKVSRAWLVREERFSSVDGPRSSFHL